MLHPLLLWFPAALSALFLYGIGQGLVKKYIGDVSPARFCLYFILAKSVVNLGFFFVRGHSPVFDAQGRTFHLLGILAYILDGTGWILYFESIVCGPIAIVGTLSAAYPALAVLFAWMFLGEGLFPSQYVGVALVISGCLGLSYTPADSNSQVTSRRWIPLAFFALVLWSTAQTLSKYAYRFPLANEANLALCNTLGGILTLGVYGLLRGGLKGSHSGKQWVYSFLPMAMMAAGDLGVIIANRFGPSSLVAPITGAYPVVTVPFAAMILKEKITLLQWVCIVLILIGLFLSTGSS